MDVALILDIVIAALLVVTICYCAVLMGKLNNLRSAQGELRGIIKGFGDAIAKAETGIVELRKAGDEAAQALDEKIDHRHRDLVAQIAKATELANDLEFMTDAGNKLADRLETGIRDARVAQPRQHTSGSYPVDDAALVGSARDENHEVKENETVETTPPSPLVAEPEPQSNAQAAKVVSEPPVVDDWDDLDDEPEDPETMKEMGARSEVERDLLQALRQSK